MVAQIAELGNSSDPKEKDKKLRDLLSKSFPVIQVTYLKKFFMLWRFLIFSPFPLCFRSGSFSRNVFAFEGKYQIMIEYVIIVYTRS